MPVSIPFTGGCACSAIRYECSAAPVMSLNCHCRDCQRASGSAYASILSVPTSAFRLLKGEPKFFEKKGDSGNTVRRGFCPDCGSPVFAYESAYPKIVILQASSLDDPSWHQPTADMYTASAHPWDSMNPQLPKFAGEPSEEEIQKLLASQQ